MSQRSLEDSGSVQPSNLGSRANELALVPATLVRHAQRVNWSLARAKRELNGERNGRIPFRRNGTEQKRHRFYASYCMIQMSYSMLMKQGCIGDYYPTKPIHSEVRNVQPQRRPKIEWQRWYVQTWLALKSVHFSLLENIRNLGVSMEFLFCQQNTKQAQMRGW